MQITMEEAYIFMAQIRIFTFLIHKYQKIKLYLDLAYISKITKSKDMIC